MSRESLEAAGLVKDSAPRSAASRYYYAAYQAISALLLYRNLIPPAGREAWSHEDTPQLLVEHLNTLIPKMGQRQDLANRLRRLYAVRLSADYISADDVTSKIAMIRKDSEFLFQTASGLLLKGRREE